MHLDRGARGLTLMDEGRQRPETLAGNGQTSRNLMTGAGSLFPLLWHAMSLGHMKGSSRSGRTTFPSARLCDITNYDKINS